MALIIDSYIKLETLETIVKTLKAKGSQGVGVTIVVNDDANDYGQNVYGFISQTKEERDAKKKKFYVLNGKVVWTDGVLPEVATKLKQTKKYEPTEKDDDDLPF